MRARVKPAHSDASLANTLFTGYFQVYAHVQFKGIRWNVLRSRKSEKKAYGYKSVDAVVAALFPLISELRDGVSIDKMALPWKVSQWKHGYLRKLSFR